MTLKYKQSFFTFEDFGGIPNDSSPGARTANNAAWLACMAAIPIVSNKMPYGVIQLGRPDRPTVYYFASSVLLNRCVSIKGFGGMFRQPLTDLVFPTGKVGIKTEFFNTGDTSSAEGASISDLGITQDALPGTWVNTHVYATGSVVQPTKWTGFVFVNEGASGTSGGSEPAWPIIIGKLSDTTNGPYNVDQTVKREGGTVADGGVTWTARYAHGIYNICDQIKFQNLYIRYVAGCGIMTVGNSNSPPQASSGDLTVYESVQIERCLTDGILMIGHDANISYGNRVNVINCGGYGWRDESIAGCFLYNSHTRSNGFTPWGGGNGFGPSFTFAAGSMVSPTDPNGFAYVTAAGGVSGTTEPTWPLTVGLTVVDGTVTWTCDRIWTGGGFRTLAGTLYGCYMESELGTDLGAVGGYLGGNLQATPSSADNGGYFLNTQGFNSPLACRTGVGANSTYYVRTGLGGPIHKGALTGIQAAIERWVDGTTLGVDLDLCRWVPGTGLWEFGPASAAASMQIATPLSSLASGSIVFPAGFYGQDGRKFGFGTTPPTTATRGDIFINEAVSTGSDGTINNNPALWVCSHTGSGTATWLPIYTGRAPVVLQQSNHAMTAADTGTWYESKASGVRVDITAVGDHVGVEGRLLVSDSNGMRLVAPAGGYQIDYGNLSCAANGYFESTEVGASIAWVSDTSSHGIKITNLIGHWNIDGTPINISGLSLATIGASPANAGATLSSNVLTLQPADGTHGGVIAASGSQTLAPNFTLGGTLTLGSGTSFFAPASSTIQLNGTNTLNFGWTGNSAIAFRISSNVNHITFDNLNNQTLFNAPIILNKNSGFTPPTTLAPGGATQTIDWNTGTTQVLDITGAGAVLTLTLSNPLDGGRYFLKILGAVGKTVAWPASVKWPGGVAPVITASAGAVDQIQLSYYAGSGFYNGTFNQAFA